MASSWKWFESSKRVQYGEENQGIDRISNLPDNVRGHILSFLPTKHAVGSTILSRKWQNIFTLITNFDFDDKVMFYRSSTARSEFLYSFKDFVDRVLML